MTEARIQFYIGVAAGTLGGMGMAIAAIKGDLITGLLCAGGAIVLCVWSGVRLVKRGLI